MGIYQHSFFVVLLFLVACFCTVKAVDRPCTEAGFLASLNNQYNFITCSIPTTITITGNGIDDVLILNQNTYIRADGNLIVNFQKSLQVISGQIYLIGMSIMGGTTTNGVMTVSGSNARVDHFNVAFSSIQTVQVFNYGLITFKQSYLYDSASVTLLRISQLGYMTMTRNTIINTLSSRMIVLNSVDGAYMSYVSASCVYSCFYLEAGNGFLTYFQGSMIERPSSYNSLKIGSAGYNVFYGDYSSANSVDSVSSDVFMTQNPTSTIGFMPKQLVPGSSFLYYLPLSPYSRGVNFIPFPLTAYNWPDLIGTPKTFANVTDCGAVETEFYYPVSFPNSPIVNCIRGQICQVKIKGPMFAYNTTYVEVTTFPMTAYSGIDYTHLKESRVVWSKLGTYFNGEQQISINTFYNNIPRSGLSFGLNITKVNLMSLVGSSVLQINLVNP